MGKLTVAIIQRRLTHYRVPLFEALRDNLDRHGVSLRLLHGEGTTIESAKNDSGRIDWAESLSTTYIAGGRLCWQPFSRAVAGSALTVMTQENAMLANHLALFQKPTPRIAFWGHGANFQGNGRTLRARYKRWSTRQVDWYFAYTRLSVDMVARSGLPLNRITQLDNAIDLEALRSDLALAGRADLGGVRASLGLGEGPVGLFLGSLYAPKRIDFLLAAAEKVRERVHGFQLLIVGDGPQRSKAEQAANQHAWVHFAGARIGVEKAQALQLASIMMNPGLLGLGILDSFAARVPMVTTDCGLHSPEIAYLAPDNGVMTADNLDSFATACIGLLTDESALDRLKSGCRVASDRYTLANMVENFTSGVLQALESR